MPMVKIFISTNTHCQTQSPHFSLNSLGFQKKFLTKMKNLSTQSTWFSLFLCFHFF